MKNKERGRANGQGQGYKSRMYKKIRDQTRIRLREGTKKIISFFFFFYIYIYIYVFLLRAKKFIRECVSVTLCIVLDTSDYDIKGRGERKEREKDRYIYIYVYINENIISATFCGGGGVMSMVDRSNRSNLRVGNTPYISIHWKLSVIYTQGLPKKYKLSAGEIKR